MCVDTAADMDRARILVEKVGNGWERLGWQELMERMFSIGAS